MSLCIFICTHTHTDSNVVASNGEGIVRSSHAFNIIYPTPLSLRHQFFCPLKRGPIAFCQMFFSERYSEVLIKCDVIAYHFLCSLKDSFISIVLLNFMYWPQDPPYQASSIIWYTMLFILFQVYLLKQEKKIKKYNRKTQKKKFLFQGLDILEN